MARTSDLDRVTAIVLQFMRTPILLLVTVYAIGMSGLVLIPGPEVDGQVTHMGFFHAFYFMTYTATTTGFGEIPSEFSEAQRMWAIACLYMSVIAWIYAIGSIFGLVQNPHFKQAVAQKKFSLAVKRIHEPFVIIAGFGDTGSLLARGLSDQYMAAVVIDTNPERIKALRLRDYRVKMPGLCGDPSVPKTLIDAGLGQPHCRAVVVLTSDENVNQKVAVMARLLNPNLQVICRSTIKDQAEELISLGKVTVVDPFEKFADELTTAIRTPRLYMLEKWLVGAQRGTPKAAQRCPMGVWILCGFGRMGRKVHHALQNQHIPVVVIDPDIGEANDIEHKISQNAKRDTLLEAGIKEAAGIVAATDDDSVNLKILITARMLNADICMVVRQNYHENEVAFQAGRADLIMQPSLVTARKILLRLISPMIEAFLSRLHQYKPEDLNEATDKLSRIVVATKPYLWTTQIHDGGTSAVMTLLRQGTAITLGDLIKHPSNRERFLVCVPIVVQRNGQRLIMPSYLEKIQFGDEILFCGSKKSRQILHATLNNAYTLQYLYSGNEPPKGYLAGWMQRKLALHRSSETHLGR